MRPGSWDSALGIATGYGLDDWGVRSSRTGRLKNFLFSTSSRPALRPTQPRIQWVPEVFSLEVKRSGREAGHLPPTSAKVKKTCGSIQQSLYTPSWHSAYLSTGNFTLIHSFAHSSCTWIRFLFSLFLSHSELSPS
jgi:hypothetical protein